MKALWNIFNKCDSRNSMFWEMNFPKCLCILWNNTVSTKLCGLLYSPDGKCDQWWQQCSLSVISVEWHSWRRLRKTREERPFYLTRSIWEELDVGTRFSEVYRLEQTQCKYSKGGNSRCLIELFTRSMASQPSLLTNMQMEKRKTGWLLEFNRILRYQEVKGKKENRTDWGFEEEARISADWDTKGTKPASHRGLCMCISGV